MGKKMSENLTNPTGLMREQEIQGSLAEYADVPGGAAVATAPSTSPTTNAAVASAAQAVASAAANVAASVTKQAAVAAQNNKDVTFVSRNYDSKYVLAAPEFDCKNRVPSTDNAWAWMNQVAREDACMPVAGGNSPCTNNAFSAIMAGY